MKIKDNFEILNIVFGYLSQLSEAQLYDLKMNKLKLQVVETSSDLKKDGKYQDVDKAANGNTVPIKEIVAVLDGFNDVDKAMDYLTSLQMTKSDIARLADSYKIPYPKKDKNEVLIKRIVDNVVGAKLNFDSLLNLNLKK